MTSTGNIQDVMSSIRVDTGVAAAAKEAESAVSQEMTQSSPSHSLKEIEEINQQVLKDSGIPNARIRKLQKVRAVGKHIEYQPARRPAVSVTRSSMLHQRSPVKNVIEPVVEDEEVMSRGEREIEMDEDEDEDDGEVDGHANEAFEAMEAMDFDADGDFDFDSENHENNDLAMNMGVD